MTDLEIFRSMRSLLARRASFALATVIEARGSTPREPGAKMIFLSDGSTLGSVGGGCGEAKVKSAAIRCMVQTASPEMVEVDLTDDEATPGGAVCGGRMLVLVEPMGPGVL